MNVTTKDASRTRPRQGRWRSLPRRWSQWVAAVAGEEADHTAADGRPGARGSSFGGWAVHLAPQARSGQAGASCVAGTSAHAGPLRHCPRPDITGTDL